MKVVIILPTYNEKENIKKVITVLEEEVFPKIHDHTMAILIADDKSPDGTADVVKELMKKWDNIEISSGEKKGLGTAYIRGMSYAVEKMNADILFEMDADLQHDPEKIPEFLKKIDKGSDMVIGTRYSDGGSIPENWPPQRKAFSIIANLFVRTVFMRFNIHDWTGGYRAMKKEVFLKEKEELGKYSGYIFQIAFLHKALRDHFIISEVPFHFSDRDLGRSKIAQFGYILDVVKFVLLTRILEFKRFIKFLFVGGTGFIIQYAVTFFCIQWGFEQFLAAMIAGEAAILSNFTLNNMWTFGDTKHIKAQGHFFRRLIKFNTASLASIGLQGLVVFLAVKYLGETTTILGYTNHTALLILFPTILLIVLPMNYFVYNRIIWKTHHLKKHHVTEK